MNVKEALHQWCRDRIGQPEAEIVDFGFNEWNESCGCHPEIHTAIAIEYRLPTTKPGTVETYNIDKWDFDEDFLIDLIEEVIKTTKESK